MGKDLIRYDLMIQEALRGVVRRVMTDAEKHGLPGDHHFFIRFKTTAPGVRISNWLREQFPDEMSVVLQHQYWDLKVTERTFEVGLSFRGSPERLLVPFEAVVEFQDPSVRFGLVFEPAEGEAGNDDQLEAPPKGRPLAELKPAGGRLTGDPLPRKFTRGIEAVERAAKRDDKKDAKPAALKRDAAKSAKPENGDSLKAGDGVQGAGQDAAADAAPPAKPAAQVVSLDQFRKKK